MIVPKYSTSANIEIYRTIPNAVISAARPSLQIKIERESY